MNEEPRQNIRKALVVDGTNYVFTHWAATQGKATETAAEAIVAFVEAWRSSFQPERVAVCFDGEGYWRREVYPQYKADRGPKDQEVLDQIALAKDLLRQKRITTLELAGFEADDLCATCVHRLAPRRVVVATRDKDAYQLLRDGAVTILKRAFRERGNWGFEYFTEADFRQAYGFGPDRWPEYLALVGQKNNWPGAAGIGEKTAPAILAAAPSLEVAMANLDALPLKPAQRDALHEFDWRTGLKLATLRRDVDLSKAAGK